jgi:hypothetical protein
LGNPATKDSYNARERLAAQNVPCSGVKLKDEVNLASTHRSEDFLYAGMIFSRRRRSKSWKKDARDS